MFKIFIGCVIVPERNNMGIAIIDNILDEFPQLKSRVYFDEKGKPGFVTTQQSRMLLFNTLLKVVVTEDYDKLHDVSIIKEIIGLRKTRSGRIDHDPNGHDDTLLGYLFTRWFFSYAPNKNRYIDPMIIGIDVPDTESEESKKEGIDHLRKTKMISSYRPLLNVHNQREGGFMINENFEIDETYRNPRLADKEWERNYRNNALNSVESTFDLISQRAKDRFKLHSSNIQRLDFDDTEKLIDSDDLYDRDPDDIEKDVQDLQKKKVNIFQAQHMGKTAEQEISDMQKKLDHSKRQLVNNVLFN